MKTKYLLFTGTVSLAMAACNGQEPETYTAQLGETCTQTKHCLSGLYCEDGTCRKICQTKDDCLSTQECIHSRCVNKSQDDPIEDEDHTDTPVDNCGNGKLDDNEQCDDGNKQTGDGCAAGCTIEANYTCDGQPSICQCAGGFQDSNSDGTCLKDCDPCGENKQCAYDQDGYATGCICTSGYQDNNNDGTCIPDCETCPDTQECLYAPDGSASCGCPEGTQDNDGNGTCEPACNATTCGDYQSCDDKSGTAICSCTVFVTPDGTGSGMNWLKAANFDQAFASANTKILEGQESCSLWLISGTYNINKTYDLNNVAILGGFSTADSTTDDRSPDNQPTIIKGDGTRTMFTATDTSFSMDNLFITGGGSPKENDHGGAIIITNSKALFNNVVFNNNGTEEYTLGGAIYMDGGDLRITDCDFAQNKGKNGAALYLRNGTGHIANTIFSNNRALYIGGAIANMADMEVDDVIFIDNFMTSTSSSATLGANIYNSSPGTAGVVAHLTVKNSQFLASLLNAPVPNDSGSCSQIGYGNAIMNTHGVVTVVNSVFSDLVANAPVDQNGNTCTTRAGAAIIHQMAKSDKSEPYSATLSYCLFNNLRSLINNKANTAFIGSNIAVYNSLLDPQATAASSSSFNQDYIVRDFGYFTIMQPAYWSTAVYNQYTNRTTITATAKIFQPGKLVGQYLVDNNKHFKVSEVLLPILENGEDYVVIPGNPLLFALLTSSTENLSLHYKNMQITVQDLRNILDNSRTAVIDQADSSVGAQPATDIFGQPRPETGKDMGPVEIGSLN